MMLRLIVVSALVALTCATECDELARIKVIGQWNQAYGDGDVRDDFGQAVFRAFFKLAPESRALFRRVHVDDNPSPSFRAHIARVLGGFDQTVSELYNPDVLEAQLAHLREQHIKLQIPGNYFTTFGKALAQVVPAVLGRCYDYDVWEACYDEIVKKIKQ